MGGAYKSFGQALGTSSGPQMSGGNFANGPLSQLQGQDSFGGQNGSMGALQEYGQGTGTADNVLGSAQSPDQAMGLMNQLATGATTGSRYATDQVQSNPILGQLFGSNGLMGQEIGKEQQLQNQGFQLTPEDNTLYGQASGDIARQSGQMGNNIAQQLAMRGLSSAPSGAAGAQFSGLAGNQNEMLAKAQQNIMQQRFQNTMGQIQQQQNFIGQLGQQGANAIQQQYGRQSQGAQQQRQGLTQSAGLQQGQNNAQNQYGQAQQQFNADHTPKNIGDAYGAGMLGGAAGFNPMSLMGGGGAAGPTGAQMAGGASTTLPASQLMGSGAAMALA